MQTLTTLRRLVRDLVDTSPRHVAACVTTIVGAGFIEGVGLVLLVPLLQLVGLEIIPGQTFGRLDAYASRVFTWTGLQPNLPLVLGVFVLLTVVQSLVQSLQIRLMSSLPQRFVFRLRTTLYRRIAASRWEFLAAARSSTFVHVLTDEIDRVRTAASLILEIAAAAVVLVVYVGLAARLAPVMTITVLTGSGLVAALVGSRMRQAQAAGERHSRSRRELHAAMADHFAGLKLAMSYNLAARHTAIFENLSGELRDVSALTAEEFSRLRRYTSIGSAVVLVCMVYAAIAWFTMPAVQLLLLLFLFSRIMPRAAGLLDRGQALASNISAYAAVKALEGECAAAAENEVGSLRVMSLHEEIRFDRVSFTYSSGTRAIEDVELVVRAGETTAIVGPSGSGKTTIADLLLGLLQPSTGRIVVDGVPLDSSMLAAWRAQIGYVTQDVFLPHASVRDNLRWGAPLASDSDIARALDLAAARDFVAGLPAGLDTILGERGVLVSGGERQRLSLARALLREPKLLILDEATSSLDSENEQLIQASIDGLRHQMTIVIIAHRLSTIRNADRIHVLDGGRLVESGTWQSLVADGDGRFLALCRAQELIVDVRSRAQRADEARVALVVPQ